MAERFRVNRRQLVAAPMLGGAVSAKSRIGMSQPSSRTLRLAGPAGGLQTLDPALTRDLASLFIVRQLFRGLLRFDRSLRPVSDLADLVDTSSDLRSFTFQLRQGVAFADGQAMTTHHVVASLERALDPVTAGGSPVSLAAVTYLGDIVGAEDLLAGTQTSLTGIEVVDERTIVITLIEPGATFLTRLASVQTAIVDARQAGINPLDWWQMPNVTGPFAVESLSDEMLVLVPNHIYVGVRPELDRIEIRIGPSAAQPINLFQAGNIDIVSSPVGQSADLLEDPASSIEATVTRTPLFATNYIALGNAQPPLDDVHIRRALQFLISPDLIAMSMFDGSVTPASGLIPDGMLGKQWMSDYTGFDVELARTEIAQSRYGDAGNVPTIPIYAADIEPIEALRDIAAAELGLVIDAVAVEWSDFLDGLAARRFPAYGLYWGADYPDPEALLGMLFRSDGSDNYTGYVNEEFDAILQRARSAAEIDSRAALYAEAQELLITDAAVIPLYFDIGVTISRPGIAGLDITPLGVLGLESVTSDL